MAEGDIRFARYPGRILRMAEMPSRFDSSRYGTMSLLGMS